VVILRQRDLGRLPEVMRRLVDTGGGVLITPIIEENRGPVIGGLNITGDETWARVTGWEIIFQGKEGAVTVSGNTVAEAVEAALADPDAW
jgi:hypothetical protein